MVDNARQELNAFRLPVESRIALVRKDIAHNLTVVALTLTNVWKINISVALALNA